MLSSADVTIAPSTYYAARTRPPSARAVRDEEVTAEISKVHEENYGVCGVRKVHAQLGRDGGVHARPVARCTVQRLMKAAGLRGISRTNGPRTTLAGAGPDSRPDLVKRDFTATAQDRLWVADLTYVRTFADACRWTSGTNSTRASPLGSGHGRGSETLGTRPYT